MLYGGQAGGGKSHLVRAAGVTLCTIWPGSVIPIFRRKYPELEETHIRKIREEIPPGVAKYVSDRHELRFPNKSILEFRYCERDDDVFQYQSAEWDALIVDEATQFSEHQIRYLRSRVRSTRPGWHPIIIYTTNPGNKSHLYFKEGFVDAAPPGHIFQAPKDDGNKLRVFLTAKLEDNPSLGPEYRDMLMGIKDEALRRALLEGDWDIFAGQFFKTWRRDKHVIDPFTPPAHWRKWGALDWGFTAPLSFGLYTQDPENKRIFRIRELYERELHDSEAIHRIHAVIGGERIDAIYADPSLWQKKSADRKDKAVSTAEVYIFQGHLPLIPANNNRPNGWRRLHDLLADGKDGLPMFQVTSNCVNFIRTIPSLVFDEGKSEDLDTDGEDHAADEWRYGCVARLTLMQNRGIVVGQIRMAK